MGGFGALRASSGNGIEKYTDLTLGLRPGIWVPCEVGINQVVMWLGNASPYAAALLAAIGVIRALMPYIVQIFALRGAEAGERPAILSALAELAAKEPRQLPPPSDPAPLSNEKGNPASSQQEEYRSPSG